MHLHQLLQPAETVVDTSPPVKENEIWRTNDRWLAKPSKPL